jgi:hypothetical protein
MKRAKYEELLAVLRRNDIERYYGESTPTVDIEELRGSLEAYFTDERTSVRAVLGIDIYQYSKYEPDLQRLIPVVFRYLYDSTVDICHSQEGFLFRGVPFKSHFISTGDGGFQILETPLHALAFAIIMQLRLQWYNASYSFPKLRAILGPLTLRYTITLDSIYRLDTNFFGSAIINNARILSRDKLNRLLLDDKTIHWFMDRIGNLESLLVLENRELITIREFREFDAKRLADTLIFRYGRPEGPPIHSFRNVIVQKIGTISAKSDAFDIYSAYIQVKLTRVGQDQDGYEKQFVVNIGNLNSAGVSE